MEIKSRAHALVLTQEKKELKKLALSIRTAKTGLKDTQRQKSILNGGNHRTQIIWGSLSPYSFEKKIAELKFEYRHRHIAYCLVRGRKYEQIENKVKNKPDLALVDKLQRKLKSDIQFRLELLLLEDKSKGLEEETQNELLGVEEMKLTCFYYGVDRSHCVSCWEPSDEDLYFLATPKSLKQVKKIFRRWVWKNYELIEKTDYSDFYPNFFNHLKYLEGFGCLFFHQSGKDYCPDLEGSLYGAEYDVRKELDPKTVFSKEEYESLLDLAKHARELEEKSKTFK